MDGIFGVGIAEMIIVGLVLFIVGGPKNSAKWAREMGKMVRQVRQAWAQMMADLENELGPEGKELMDAARELGKGAREVSSMAQPSRLVGETMRMVETAVDANKIDNPKETSPAPASPVEPAAPPVSGTNENTNGNKYTAWIPPDRQ